MNPAQTRHLTLARRSTRSRLWRAGPCVTASIICSLASAPLAAQSGGPGIETVVVTGSRTPGPAVSASGANDYSLSSADIAALPAGEYTAMTDVLAQMPGVAIDQNQQIHIRDTEGPQFQYRLDGVLVPFDINTNPPFLSMLNPAFISQLDLLTGILPARYSYATGGVVDIRTKDGCEGPGGAASVLFGQRGMFEPSVEYAGCDDAFSWFGSLLYGQNNLAFSSATPGPTAVHDETHLGQGFGVIRDRLDPHDTLEVIAGVSDSDNQLPNVPGLTPQFQLAGAPVKPSADIDSWLNFRDYLGIVSLTGDRSQNLSYRIAWSGHAISEMFVPDDVGELLYQGVASTATHRDFDNTFEGDLDYVLGPHTLSGGFYMGMYNVTADDSSLVFPVNAQGDQSSTTPVRVVNNAQALNLVSGLYVNDLWQVDSKLRANLGLRWDKLTGFTDGSAVDPTLNLGYSLTDDTTVHGGIARYMQVPSFLGISPNAPAAFAGTTAEGPPGIVTPTVENDWEWDAGVVHKPLPGLTLSADGFYEITKHYLDTGQFGVVPIFAPFNYDSGYMWGVELATAYGNGPFSGYVNLTLGRNWQKGVATGQFNFDPDELDYIDTHPIILDHQPLVGLTAGASYNWQPWTFGADLVYSSGLKAGFADLEQLPSFVQVNLSVQRSFEIPCVGEIDNRLTILNALDRTNLIRPSEGIGIFQSAYGPRLTVFDSITVPLQ